MELKGKKIAFLGDSITEGVGTTAPEFRYVDRIAKQAGAVCLNYGISGTRFAKQTKPSDEPTFDLDFCKRALEMDKDADIVIVFGGTNDFGHGDAPFGTFADRTPDTFCGACHTLCRELLETYPDSEIAFISPLHRDNEDSPVGDNKPAPVGTLKDYIDAMRQILAYYSIPVIDLYAESKLQPHVAIIKEKFMPDGLHPSDAGNEILAKKIIAYLKAL